MLCCFPYCWLSLFLFLGSTVGLIGARSAKDLGRAYRKGKNLDSRDECHQKEATSLSGVGRSTVAWRVQHTETRSLQLHIPRALP